jgi:DNA invertase Pin-like site-specific DNA recombinase
VTSSELIQAAHLERQALIYVRQSTPQQAVSNQESLHLQYALQRKARDYGWPDERIVVIDADLGMTGSTAVGREGFKELVSRVSLGQAGIIFAYDVTRLARNCSDWYQLLDICGLRRCLIGDHDAIHDPASINGRLLLGLKGQISELELHTIRARLNAGMLNKARRGELVVAVPVGFQKSADSRIVKDPDQEVQERTALVFATFLRVKSLGGVVRYFNQHGLLLPRNDRLGAVRWREPTCASVSSMLRNPTYAGAYAYGKTRYVPQNSAPHKRRKKPVDASQWKVLLHDRHEGYIDWVTFERIQAILTDNFAAYCQKPSRGAPRKGAALLQGIAFCGQCGRQMTAQYRQGPLYVCNHLYQGRRLPVCQRVRAESVDAAVVTAFWQALAPAELQLLDQAQRQLAAEAEQIRKARLQQLQRLQYHVRLAERQYQACDPDNRLVASELERRWEQTLCELRNAEEQLERDQSIGSVPIPLLTPAIEHAWQQAGIQLPQMWNDGRLNASQKKSLLRSLVQKVILHKHKPGRVHLRIVWRGGAVTETEATLRVATWSCLPSASNVQAEIVRLARSGLSDEWIAYSLSQQGCRSAYVEHVPINAVIRQRTLCRVPSAPAGKSPPSAGWLTLQQASRRIGISRTALFSLILQGSLRLPVEEPSKRFLVPNEAGNLRDLRKLHNGEIDCLHLT